MTRVREYILASIRPKDHIILARIPPTFVEPKEYMSRLYVDISCVHTSSSTVSLALESDVLVPSGIEQKGRQEPVCQETYLTV